LLVTLGKSIVLSLQGLGFWAGVLGFLVAAGLVILAMGRFAVAGMFLDPQLGHEITFRFIGAAIGFVVISSAAF
jgi:ABC-type molybdate transport system permease subunit